MRQPDLLVAVAGVLYLPYSEPVAAEPSACRVSLSQSVSLCQSSVLVCVSLCVSQLRQCQSLCQSKRALIAPDITEARLVNINSIGQSPSNHATLLKKACLLHCIRIMCLPLNWLLCTGVLYLLYSEPVVAEPSASICQSKNGSDSS